MLPVVAGLGGIRETGDAGKDFLGVLAGGEVADAVEALAGDVPEQAPQVGLGVVNLLIVAGDDVGRRLLLRCE